MLLSVGQNIEPSELKQKFFDAEHTEIHGYAGLARNIAERYHSAYPEFGMFDARSRCKFAYGMGRF